MVRNKIQLITYPDSLGSNLKDLNFVLNKYFKNLIGGVHILPFFPSSADRGFAPLNYDEVDAKFGNWDDIKEISKNFEIMADFIMNHVSSKSYYFQHYMMFGEESHYADMFLTYNKVFGKLSKEMADKYTKMIYRPRPTEPFLVIHLPDKSEEKVWVTFSPDQIDIDWNSKVTRDIMAEALFKLKENGVNYLRLDAAGYTSKRAGTSCFFNEEVYDYINWVKDKCGGDIKMLPEVHNNYRLQLDIANRCDYTYDFQLTALILDAIYFGDSRGLKNWIKIRPNNMFTVLDTHDGIGIIDGEDLLSLEELKNVKDKLFENGGNIAYRASGENSENLDVYQVNCTYYSALNENDDAYLLARAIQFFVPGIPQVYYVGLLAGKNDGELLDKTGVGRDVNRHYYSLEEIECEIEKPVVKKLLELMNFRNNYDAFDGDFELNESSNNLLSMSWKKGKYECKLSVDLQSYMIELKYVEIENDEMVWKSINLNSIPITNLNKNSIKLELEE